MRRLALFAFLIAATGAGCNGEARSISRPTGTCDRLLSRSG